MCIRTGSPGQLLLFACDDVKASYGSPAYQSVRHNLGPMLIQVQVSSAKSANSRRPSSSALAGFIERAAARWPEREPFVSEDAYLHLPDRQKKYLIVLHAYSRLHFLAKVASRRCSSSKKLYVQCSSASLIHTCYQVNRRKMVTVMPVPKETTAL